MVLYAMTAASIACAGIAWISYLRARTALRESRARFQRTFDHMLEGCQIISRDWRFLYVNDGALGQALRPREALIGKTVAEAYPGIDSTELFAKLRRCMVERVAIRTEEPFAHPDGRVRWYDLSIQPCPEGIFILSIDTTDRRAAEDRFATTTNRLQTLLDALPVGVSFSDDATCRRITGNPELLRQFAIRQGDNISPSATDPEAPGRKLAFFRDGIPLTDAELPVQLAVKENRPIPPSEIEVVLPDGRRWFALASGAPLRDANGAVVGGVGVTIDVTEQKRIQLELREKEEKLHASDRRLAKLVQGMSEGCFILDGQWRFVFLNDRCEALLQRVRSELIGCSIYEIFPQLNGSPYEPHYLRTMREHVPSSFVAFSNLAARWLDVRLFPTHDGLAAFLLDIDERKRTEDALHRSEAQAAAVLRALAEGVVLFNPEGEVEVANEAVKRNLGRIPRGLRELGDPQLDPSIVPRRGDGSPFPLDDLPTMVALRTGQSVRDVEVGMVAVGGELRWFSTNADVVRDATGTILGTVASFFDITDRKRVEGEVRQLNEELEQRVAQRTAQLEASNKELEAFSYSVSHDLRAPLRAIDGFARILGEEFAATMPSEARELFDDIRTNARQMGRLIDDLLAFSRLSRKPIERVTVDVADLVERCLSEVRPTAQRRCVEFRIGQLADCDGDPALLKQVWLNLLSNSVKYTGKRDRGVVEIGSEANGREVTYSIRDNGVGFDMRYAHKLFGVFQRLHRAEDYEGTGVGLAIVHRIVHRHDGRVWAEAKPGVGATFFFALPTVSSVKIGE